MSVFRVRAWCSALVLTAGGVLIGCGAADSPTQGAGTCTPGKVETCPCPNGATGTQECLPDGSGLGPCTCEPSGGDAFVNTDTAPGCVDGAACDDGSECTTDDVCQNGTCVGTAIDCDDDNPCTDDGCDSSGCAHAPSNDMD